MTKKKVLLMAGSIVLAFALLVAVGIGFLYLSGNQITAARCIVTDSGALYMVYDGRPVKLNGADGEYQTGDQLLVIHQAAFAESYPEQCRAYLVIKAAAGSQSDVPQSALDVLIETGNIGGTLDKADNTFPIDLETLKEMHPAYFGLETMKGLNVYVWQMAAGSYSCGLLPGKNIGYTQEELWSLHKSSTSLDEMRAIVASYFPDISREDVLIIPITMPHSSYAYPVDDAYIAQLEALFWEDLSE